MKKLVLFVILALFAVTAGAIGISKPAVKVTQTEQGVDSVVTTKIRTNVILYGNSDVIQIHIQNLTTVAIQYGVTIVQPGAGALSAVFIPDAGCNMVVAPQATCTVNVTYTPPYPSADGSVLVDDDSFVLTRKNPATNIVIAPLTYTIEGLSQ